LKKVTVHTHHITGIIASIIMRAAVRAYL
jgi:hypothetical protein